PAPPRDSRQGRHSGARGAGDPRSPHGARRGGDRIPPGERRLGDRARSARAAPAPRTGDDFDPAPPVRAHGIHGRVTRRLVVDLASPRAVWRIPPAAVQSIRATLGSGWEVIQVEAPAASDGDGGSGSPEAVAAARGAEIYLGYGVPAGVAAAGRGTPRWGHTATAGGGARLRPPPARGGRGAEPPPPRREGDRAHQQPPRARRADRRLDDRGPRLFRPRP